MNRIVAFSQKRLVQSISAFLIVLGTITLVADLKAEGAAAAVNCPNSAPPACQGSCFWRRDVCVFRRAYGDCKCMRIIRVVSNPITSPVSTSG
jgi:hypothetical protein